MTTPVDPQIQAFLDDLAGLPPIHTLPVDIARQASFPPAPKQPVHHVEDRIIPGPGGDIPVRLYYPRAGDQMPALVFIHGGGWVIGSLDDYDAICRSLALEADCVVISVDYRLAPEHKFPAAPDDALAATTWAFENAVELGIDADRIAIGGDSAGGNLSAVTTVRLRNNHRLAAQLLIYPMTVYHDPPLPSHVENAEGYMLTIAAMDWFMDHYLPDATFRSHPHFAVGKTEDLTDLPPALIITAQFDPLRDDGEAYAARLRDAGVAVDYWRYDGMIHGFYGMFGVDKGAEALSRSAAWLKEALKG